MIPFLSKSATSESSNNSYYEYELDFVTGELTGEKVYGIDAIKIWIYKALKTKRYQFTAYTWDFGHEFESLIGSSYERGYIESEVTRMVKDALSVNDKIKRCHSFNISRNDEELHIAFTVDTIFGMGEVNIIV